MTSLDFENIADCCKGLVTFATGIGFLVLLFVSIKLSYKVIQGLRLYVFSQYCCPVDFKERYGQWAVISGSTDGIGLAFARELARRGMSIIVIGRNEQKLAATRDSLEKEPNVGQVITIKIDLSDSSLENFDSIREQIDPDNRDIGLLINNAGAWPTQLRRYNRYEMEFILRLVNLNILSTLHLTRMIMPGMLARGKGLVVNVSSLAGSMCIPYGCVYGPTKSFIDRFSRQLQIEYSRHPIDIINLTPGAIQTSLLQRTWNIRRTSPLSPTPDDYARSTLGAISTRLGSISGTMLHGLTIESSKYFNWLVPHLFTTACRLAGADWDLSPVPTRRRRRIKHNQSATSESLIGGPATTKHLQQAL